MDKNGKTPPQGHIKPRREDRRPNQNHTAHGPAEEYIDEYTSNHEPPPPSKNKRIKETDN